MTNFALERIAPDLITATDLRREYEELTRARESVECYQITIYDERGRPHPEAAQALFIPEAGRMGITWGADATWAGHIDDPADGVHIWQSDPDEWQARN